MSSVKYYRGRQITSEVVESVKKIAHSRCSEHIYQNYWEYITSPQELARAHHVPLSRECVVLGRDWFLCFGLFIGSITLQELVAEETVGRKISQTIEMYTALKNVLLRYRKRRFSAILRHDTGYQLYKTAGEYGNIIELAHEELLDECLPPEVASFIEKQHSRPPLSELIKSGDYPEEFPHYVVHSVEFRPSHQFCKKRQGIRHNNLTK